MSEAEDVSFTLEVMLNKERSKILFAEADSHFADILLSFLTLPLGRIAKVLDKHCGDAAPAIGSLTTLYQSLANLGTFHFWTEGAKLTLLNPLSSFEFEYKSLKLDVYDYQPAEYFQCTNHTDSRIRCVSLYFDSINKCGYYGECEMIKEVDEKRPGAASSDGVFTRRTESFIISDDLKILPSDTGPFGVISILGITEIDNAVPIRVTFGLNEIMSLLKASLISPTPLSDLILNKTTQMSSVMVKSEPETLPHQIEWKEDPCSKKMILKLMIQKSSSKLLYAKAEEDFVEFLFSLLNIPLGGLEHLLAGRTCIKAINNLYRSTSELIRDKYFKTPDLKNRLMKSNLPHGCVSKNHILPLTEESLPADYYDFIMSSSKFPKGRGSYLAGPGTYKVMDDLTVTPFRNVSIFSGLNKLKISITDVKEVQLQIGLKEGLSILKASLTSTSALTDGLLNHISLSQTKQKP